MDSLVLPFPINGSAEDGEQRFESVEEAERTLRDELRAWLDQNATTECEETPNVIDLRPLFDSEGVSLSARLSVGVERLDANLDKVRLDR